MNDSNSAQPRLSELEFQAAHVQRLYDQLNEVVTQQSGLIDRLQRRVAKLEHQLQDARHKSETPIDPYDEKPPHY